MRGERWKPRGGRRWLPLTAYLLLLTSCAVTPLTNRLSPGEEPFVVAVGEGPDSLTDLYAAPAGGGAFVRLTYSRAQEAAPRLSSGGTLLVFLRSSPVETTDPEPEIVVLNLLSGSERRIRLPRSGGAARGAAWLAGDSVLVVRSDSGLWRFRAPPDPAELTELAPAERSRADSALGVVLGDPPFGTVERCGEQGPCVRAAGGELTLLGAGVSGVLRWGPDSVGYFTGDGFEVRPLGGGRSRRPAWKSSPVRLRELSYHPGQVTTTSGVSGRR